MYSYLTPAVVLRRRDHRESDRIYTLLTETQGKVSVVAQGVRKPESKLAGSIESGAVVQVMCIVARTFDRLAGVVVLTPWSAQSAGDIWLRQRYLDAVDALVQDGHADARVFETVKNTMAVPDRCTPQQHAAALWELLSTLGFSPRVDQCGSCQLPLDQQVAFAARAQGFVHQTCVRAGEEVLRIESHIWARLCALGSGKTQVDVEFTGDVTEQRDLQQVLDSLIDLHAHRRRLVSVGFGV
jgi:DNA repair protein RecO (recombination protein O)